MLVLSNMPQQRTSLTFKECGTIIYLAEELASYLYYLEKLQITRISRSIFKQKYPNLKCSKIQNCLHTDLLQQEEHFIPDLSVKVKTWIHAFKTFVVQNFLCAFSMRFLWNMKMNFVSRLGFHTAIFYSVYADCLKSEKVRNLKWFWSQAFPIRET